RTPADAVGFLRLGPNATEFSQTRVDTRRSTKCQRPCTGRGADARSGESGGVGRSGDAHVAGSEGRKPDAAFRDEPQRLRRSPAMPEHSALAVDVRVMAHI